MNKPTQAQGEKFALITGAAGGIGQAMVKEFAANGYTVIATDRASVPEGLGAHHYIAADLARTVEEEAYAAEILVQVKRLVGENGLSALVNNAAVQILGGVEHLSRQDWSTTLNVNLLAPFIWTQGLLPELERAQGSVVNISSIHARLTKSNFVAYATSKAALSGMTRAMAIDLGSKIRVNAIEPAAIATDMLREGFSQKPDSFRSLELCHPQERIGQPNEVAKFAVALCRPGSEFIHGACIEIDGGIGSRLFDPQ